MNESQTVKIQTDFDIIKAQMQVRKLAQTMGLKTVDQVCIAIATASLARALGLGEAHQGQIAMNGLRKGERTGVRVVCTKADATERDLSPSVFGDIHWMVDELTVETQPFNDLQVTLVKWLA